MTDRTKPSDLIEGPYYEEALKAWEEEHPTKHASEAPTTYLMLQAVMKFLDRSKLITTELTLALNEEDEECNCDQALALKERVAELEAQQDIMAHDLLPAFFKAVDTEIVQPNGGTLADLYETRFILGRLISETGVLSDALYDMTGFDKNADDVIRSQCVKVAACAALILIRRQNDNEDDMEDEPGDE